MTRNDVMTMVEGHNARIDKFMDEILPVLLEGAGVKVVDGKIAMTDWFVAQRFINVMNFYEAGMAILKPAREQGFDVKMDMQSNKLVF